MTSQDIKLSSNWTNVGLYGSFILILLMVPITFFIMKNQEFHAGMLISIALLIAIIGFQVYLFRYTCDARIKGEKLFLKKQFRPEKQYSFDKIGYPTSFRIKSTKYVSVEMINDDNTTEKYIIINSKALLAFENKDAEQILIDLINKEKFK